MGALGPAWETTVELIRLLVVDDSGFSRRMLVKRLPPEFKYRITEASDGHEAIETYERGLFDLVFMDLTMPRMGGLEAIGHILAKDPDARVVVVTADIQQQSRERVRELGACNLIAKPAATDDLRAEISALG